jgi:hypothetical protein
MTMSLSLIAASVCRRACHWLLLFVFLFAAEVTFAQAQQWLQWGGPNRNFKAALANPVEALRYE